MVMVVVAVTSGCIKEDIMVMVVVAVTSDSFGEICTW